MMVHQKNNLHGKKKTPIWDKNNIRQTEGLERRRKVLRIKKAKHKKYHKYMVSLYSKDKKDNIFLFHEKEIELFFRKKELSIPHIGVEEDWNHINDKLKFIRKYPAYRTFILTDGKEYKAFATFINEAIEIDGLTKRKIFIEKFRAGNVLLDEIKNGFSGKCKSINAETLVEFIDENEGGKGRWTNKSDNRY